MRIVAFIVGILAGFGAHASPAAPPRLGADALFTTETMTIDGRLDEAIWSRVKPVPFMVPVTHDVPKSKTIGKLCWDEDYLYVGFQASDEDLKAIDRKRDGNIWKDDVLEIFLLLPHPIEVVNFEVNIVGSMLDGRRGYPNEEYNMEGFKKGIVVNGTLNDDSDRDQGWSLEVAIPFSELPGQTGAPPVGAEWRFHLARYDWSAYLEGGRELSSTAPLSQVNFHLREEWIPLYFKR